MILKSQVVYREIRRELKSDFSDTLNKTYKFCVAPKLLPTWQTLWVCFSFYHFYNFYKSLLQAEPAKSLLFKSIFKEVWGSERPTWQWEVCLSFMCFLQLASRQWRTGLLRRPWYSELRSSRLKPFTFDSVWFTWEFLWFKGWRRKTGPGDTVLPIQLRTQKNKKICLKPGKTEYLKRQCWAAALKLKRIRKINAQYQVL